MTVETHASFPVTAAKVADGARFCGLFAMPPVPPAGGVPAGAVGLLSVVSDGGTLGCEDVVIAPGETRFESLAPQVPAADWYERQIHDLFGLEPAGHPHPDPLVFPVPHGTRAPLGVGGDPSVPIEPDLSPLRAHVHGEGVFTIPYGPVRSGVFESVEYLLETAGEDIPHLRTRVFYKHRGVEARFAGMSPDDGVLLAERVEGVASVAHAIAFCGALERLGEVSVPPGAELVRAVHAELERVANHLDTVVRHTEAAGQAVAYACFSHHKERVQRLRTRLCGSRFGRGVVVPGGVARLLRLTPGEIRSALGELQRAVTDDLRRLMETPSFVDRLRGTGVLTTSTARRLAVVGPVGRASGEAEDLRTSREYGAYRRLGHRPAAVREAGDALARQHVRIDEIAEALRLAGRAVDLLDELPAAGSWRAHVPVVDGRALGWAEAPQGELLSVVEVGDGRLTRVVQRSASFHNLAAYPFAFPKDIFTDVAFVEASFGLSVAGAAG